MGTTASLKVLVAVNCPCDLLVIDERQRVALAVEGVPVTFTSIAVAGKSIGALLFQSEGQVGPIELILS